MCAARASATATTTGVKRTRNVVPRPVQPCDKKAHEDLEFERPWKEHLRLNAGAKAEGEDLAHEAADDEDEDLEPELP